MMPRLKPRLVCPGSLLITSTEHSSSRGRQQQPPLCCFLPTSMCCQVNTFSYAVPSFPVDLLRTYYNYPSSRKSSLISLLMVLSPLAFHSLLSCLVWWVISFVNCLPSHKRTWCMTMVFVHLWERSICTSVYRVNSSLYLYRYLYLYRDIYTDVPSQSVILPKSL